MIVVNFNLILICLDFFRFAFFKLYCLFFLPGRNERFNLLPSSRFNFELFGVFMVGHTYFQYVQEHCTCQLLRTFYGLTGAGQAIKAVLKITLTGINNRRTKNQITVQSNFSIPSWQKMPGSRCSKCTYICRRLLNSGITPS